MKIGISQSSFLKHCSLLFTHSESIDSQGYSIRSSVLSSILGCLAPKDVCARVALTFAAELLLNHR